MALKLKNTTTDKIATTADKKELKGSILEFTFGPNRKKYFATSYPHPIRDASKDDFRIKR
jgi:hypothetical protein